MNHHNRQHTWMLLAGLVFIVVPCLVVYIPAMRAGYIWDDDIYVEKNPLLKAPDGLWRIWLGKDLPSQYFPMVYTTFYFEHALWGLKPFGYHLTNIILHTVNALLLWCLLSRLNIRGAWLVSAIFALHPVHTESVAWITERKNVLSTLFYLTSALTYLRYELQAINKPGKKRSETFYIVSGILFLCALSSKAVTCTLPVALLLVHWWKRGRIGWKDVRDLSRFFVLAIAWGLFIMFWEHTHQGTGLIDLGLTPIKRMLIACRALWFYIGKLLCPVNLTFSYPPWNIDATDPLQYSWLLLSLIVAWAMWHWRDKLGRGPIAAIVFFVVTLSPMLGFLSLLTFLYTYVADHYQYVASIGPITLFVGLGYRTVDRLGKRAKGIAMVIVVFVLATLGTLTWRQSHIYKDQETLWRDTIRKNPHSYMAHNNLGALLYKQDKVDEAIASYNEALKIKPDNIKTIYNLGTALKKQGDVDGAIRKWEQVLEIDPNYADAHCNIGLAMKEQGKYDQAVKHFNKALQRKNNLPALYYLGLTYTQIGNYDLAIQNFNKVLLLKPDFLEARTSLAQTLLKLDKTQLAVDQYYKILRFEPDSIDVLNRLARILATNKDTWPQNPNDAVKFAEHACELTGYSQPGLLDTLAIAYAAAGRFAEAVPTAEKAIILAQDANNQQLADKIKTRLQLYMAAQPYRQ